MEGETLDTWITRLTTLMKDCNFAEQKDRILRDQTVFCWRDSASSRALRPDTIRCELIDIAVPVLEWVARRVGTNCV